MQQQRHEAGEDLLGSTPPMGRLYQVGGRKLLLHSAGTSGPAVVFLPGAGMTGLDYLNVHERAAELTTSVIYDRAGTGWSDPADLPRSAAEVTSELRELLRAAGIPAPYLLAGHSLGGAYARLYAQRFPGEVAGLLLLDTSHEDQARYFPREIAEMQEQMKNQPVPELPEEVIQLFLNLFQEKYANWPNAVRTPLIDYHTTAWQTGLLEARNFDDEVAGELRRAGHTPDIPTIVLTAMGLDPGAGAFMPEPLQRTLNEGKRALHADLAASLPRGEQRVLDDASHAWLHIEQPDAVLQAIADLLGAAEQ